MRQVIAYGVERETLETAYPWAAVIIEVDGGFACFESVLDAMVLAKQL